MQGTNLHSIVLSVVHKERTSLSGRRVIYLFNDNKLIMRLVSSLVITGLHPLYNFQLWSRYLNLTNVTIVQSAFITIKYNRLPFVKKPLIILFNLCEIYYDTRTQLFYYEVETNIHFVVDVLLLYFTCLWLSIQTIAKFFFSCTM